MSKIYVALIETVLVLLMIVGLVLGIRQVWSWKKAAEANAQTIHQQAATATATTTISTDASAKQTEAQRVDVVVTEKRADYEANVNELVRTDAGAAAWRDAPVPAGLRDAAHARRLARDRLAGAEVGSGRDDAGADVARQAAP